MRKFIVIAASFAFALITTSASASYTPVGNSVKVGGSVDTGASAATSGKSQLVRVAGGCYHPKYDPYGAPCGRRAYHGPSPIVQGVIGAAAGAIIGHGYRQRGHRSSHRSTRTYVDHYRDVERHREVGPLMRTFVHPDTGEVLMRCRVGFDCP
jgi:hypothetical protein